MARRKARPQPSLVRQAAAMSSRFSQTYSQRHIPKTYTIVRTRDDGSMCEIDVLTRVLRRHHIAAELSPPLQSRPVQWAQYRAAVNWLRRDGFTSLSDAERSRCVKSLMRFLRRWRARLQQTTGQRQAPPAIGTAAELAGTLIALAGAFNWRTDAPCELSDLSTA